MPAVARSLQFDHHQICLGVDCQEIDSALAIFPVAKFFGQDVKVIRDYINLSSEESL